MSKLILKHSFIKFRDTGTVIYGEDMYHSSIFVLFWVVKRKRRSPVVGQPPVVV